MAAFIAQIYQQRYNLRRNRVFRDRLHPLDRYGDIELFGKFRFRRQNILELTDKLKELIELPNRKGALPPVVQVWLTLRFYACGLLSRCVRRVDRRPPSDSKSYDYPRDGG